VYLYEKGVLTKEVTADTAEEVLFTRIEELSHAQ
jgi:hypothetical protein